MVVENIEDYRKQLLSVLENDVWSDIYSFEGIQYWTDTFQNAIDRGNEDAQRREKR